MPCQRVGKIHTRTRPTTVDRVIVVDFSRNLIADRLILGWRLLILALKALLG